MVGIVKMEERLKWKSNPAKEIASLSPEGRMATIIIPIIMQMGEQK
jgi:hypothetical protein